MSAYTNNSKRKTLYRCIVAIALVTGLFSGYTSYATSHLKSRSQTERVEFRKPLKKVHSIYENESNPLAKFNGRRVQNEFFILLAQNRLTRVSSKVNQKLVQYIPDINSIQFKHRPQFSDDYFISA